MEADSTTEALPSGEDPSFGWFRTAPSVTPARVDPLGLHGTASAVECAEGPSSPSGILVPVVAQEGSPAMTEGPDDREGEGRVGAGGVEGAAATPSASPGPATTSLEAERTTPSTSAAGRAVLEPSPDRGVLFGCRRSPGSVSVRAKNNETDGLFPLPGKSSGLGWASPPVSHSSRSSDVDGVAVASSGLSRSALLEAGETSTRASRPGIARDQDEGRGEVGGARRTPTMDTGRGLGTAQGIGRPDPPVATPMPSPRVGHSSAVLEEVGTRLLHE